MAADDRDSGIGGVLDARELLSEGLGTNNVQGGHTEQALGVEDTSILQNLSGNGDSGVDGVGDDESEGLWGELGNALDKSLDNAGIDLEKVVTGHTRLAYMSPILSAKHDKHAGYGATHGEYRPG